MYELGVLSFCFVANNFVMSMLLPSFVGIIHFICIFCFVFVGFEQLSMKPGIAYFTITIWMNLIWFSFLILFCSSNKMYSFEMEILCAQAKQRWNKFLLIHIIFVGWKKWFNIFQRNNDEYKNQTGQMWLWNEVSEK